MRSAHFDMLPLGAFQHCGDKKIKLYGPAKAVGNFVGDVVEGVGNFVSDAGSFIDDAVNEVVPGGWATVAAVATMNPELIGLESVAAPLELTAETAMSDLGYSAVAPEIATEVVAPEVLASTPLELTADTAMSDLGYSSVAPDVATEVAGTGSSLNTDSILNSALKGAGKGALTGGLTSAVMGGDPLQGALMGGVTGGVGGAVGNTAYQLTDSNVLGGVAGGAAGAGTSALLGGRDPLTGALIGGLSGGTTAGINELTGSNLGSTIAPLTGSLISGAINGTPSTSLNTLTGGNMASDTTNLMNTGTGLMSGSSTLGGSSGTSSGLPTYLPATGLAGAPVYAQNAEILKKLKQLNPEMFRNYPQLETANPKFLQTVFGNPETQATAQQNINPLSPLVQATFQANPTGMGTKYAKKGGSQTLDDLPSVTVTGKQEQYPLDPMSYGALQSLVSYFNKSQARADSKDLMSQALKMLSPQGTVSGGYRSGGATVNDDGEEHIPEFITGATGHYVKGRGDGQSDDIPAMLADGEYVFDADTVAQLGNGSSDAGAKLLDHFREALREHKRSASADKIPPKASPLAYMKEALKRHSSKGA